ncbi:hypothetical protein CSC74_08595 [Pseudoxanthomonas yeongjuensis]|nr:hypothetical protein CSC74_08595 [Pseudoxanthomonas yeongjuensis]
MAVMLVFAGACRAQSADIDPAAMAQMYSSMGDPGSAARMSDSDASCEQLYAESNYLDARVAAMPKAMDPMEVSAKMQEDMMAAQKKAMGGMRAKGMASSLLSMIPGVGGIAGGLASSALSRSSGGMEAAGEATRKAMKEMQDNNQAMMAGAQLQMRKGHVTRLFLARDCKVSTLDRSLVASARGSLEASKGESAAMAIPQAAVPPMQAQAVEASSVGQPSTEAQAPVGASE